MPEKTNLIAVPGMKFSFEYPFLLVRPMTPGNDDWVRFMFTSTCKRSVQCKRPQLDICRTIATLHRNTIGRLRAETSAVAQLSYSLSHQRGCPILLKRCFNMSYCPVRALAVLMQRSHFVANKTNTLKCAREND